MPPKEESNFKYFAKHLETGEYSELCVLGSPFSFPKDEELYEPPTIFCGTMEMDVFVNKKFLRDHYKAIYTGCNNYWKIHGRRTFRWRTYLRTIRSAGKKFG